MEVKLGGDVVSVRDTKYRRPPGHEPEAQPTITVQLGDWVSFVDRVTADEGRTVADGALRTAPGADGGVDLTTIHGDDVLRYTAAEWDAFVGGVRLGEFHPILR